MQPKTIEVIHVQNLERTKRFYEALGYVLKREDHPGCPVHYSVDFGTFLWEFYPAKSTAVMTYPSKDRRIFVDVVDFETIIAICAEMDLDRDPIKFYDQERSLRSVIVQDPDGWRIHVREIAFDANPPVH